MTEITIPLRSQDEAIQVLGPYDRHAKLLRRTLDIEIFTRGGNLRLKGADHEIAEARGRIEHLLGKLRKGRVLEPAEIEAILIGPPAAGEAEPASKKRSERAFFATPARGEAPSGDGPARLRPRPVEPRSKNQRLYLEAIKESSLTFGLGSAGTGKTFLAVAAAVSALRRGEIRRLIVSRPVVEAGERLGFLPGDLQAKLDPYMRPVYDALFELVGSEDVGRLEQAGVIEVAPLAYMRGRTLSHAFVILDEAQNTTVSQMKMFLTRLGEGSNMVVTGDPTQADLDDALGNGLVDAVQRLRGFAGVSVIEFVPKDIVRHPLVEQIVRAYETPSRRAAERERAPNSPRK